MALPLEGIKVVDLTVWVMGPSAAALLADAGADVVKIEDREGGDPVRGFLGGGIYPSTTPINYGIELGNRNKRSVALSLRQPEGREIAYKLVERADVFVSNMLSPSLKRLGMDYETLSRLNPRLIYAHGTGYGPKGPEKDRTNFAELAWGRGGFMSLLGEPDAPPVFDNSGATLDLGGGLSLYAGIMTALFNRERTGKGQKVDVSLYSIAVWLNGWCLEATLATGKDIPRRSRKRPGSPLYTTYQAKDGRWFILCMPQIERHWPILCRAIGRDDLITDPRFNTMDKVIENNAEAIALLDKIFATKDLAEWARAFSKEDIIWAHVATGTEIVSDPQALANDLFVEVEHPTGQRIKIVAGPFQLNETPLQIKSAAPILGQHTEEVLLELGYDWDQIIAFKDKSIII